MKVKLYSILLLLFIISSKSIAQTGNYELFVTVNGNLYIPVDNPNKGVYPIIGYDKETDPKLLIGGFGVGLSAFMPVGDKLSAKGQANVSKHTYWDEPVAFVDEFRQSGPTLLAGSSDYSIGLAATVNYPLTKKISVGTGIGGQILLVSLSRLPEVIIHGSQNEERSLVAVNRYYKPFMPTLPVELSYKAQKKLFNVRYEHALLNRIKGDLKNYKKDNFGLLTFEVGFRIKE